MKMESKMERAKEICIDRVIKDFGAFSNTYQ